MQEWNFWRLNISIFCYILRTKQYNKLYLKKYRSNLRRIANVLQPLRNSILLVQRQMRYCNIYTTRVEWRVVYKPPKWLRNCCYYSKSCRQLIVHALRCVDSIIDRCVFSHHFNSALPEQVYAYFKFMFKLC